MTDPFRDDYTYLTELPEELREKRAAAARRRRWRRRLGVAGLLAVAGAVVALAVTSLSGGGSEGGEKARSEAAEAAAPSFPADWKPHPGPVAILEYHAIQPPVAGAADPNSFVTQADFVDQMRWLEDQGFEAVTLDQVEDAWYEDGELPPRPVVVSFEDGYLSQYVAAFPELEELGWKGVLNLKASGSDLPDANAKEMLRAGWELGSHTITNPDLTTVAPAELQREVAGSRQILRQRFGVPVDNLAYPSGSYDDAVISAVAKAGYRGAQTETFGVADAAHPYILERIVIELDDGVPGLVEKLRSAGAA